MKHLVIFFYIASLLVGVSTLVFMTITYYKLSLRNFKFYILFLWSFFFYSSFNLLRTYIVNMVQPVSPEIHLYTFSLHFIFIPLFFLLLSLMMNGLSGKKISRLEKIYVIFIQIYCLLCLIIPVIQTAGNPEETYKVLFHELSCLPNAALLSIFMSIMMIFVVRNFRRIEQPFVRKVLKSVFYSTIFFIAGMFIIFFLIRENKVLSELLPLFDGGFVFIFYFLILSIINFHYFIIYVFDKNIQKETNFHSVFAEKHDLSQREQEVIELALEDLTYQQMADKLFVSPRTIETHLSTIYKKTNVRNKKELIDFFQDFQRKYSSHF